MLAFVVAAQQHSSAQEGPSVEAAKQLTVDRIFQRSEFRGPTASARFVDGWPGYFVTRKSQDTEGGQDLVRFDFESETPEIVVPAAHLIPAGESQPLSIAGYEFSADRSRLLIFTNTKRVWRYNTRGDYWVLDRASRELKQLGGETPASSMMFAKFSPDGTQVAYVVDGNLRLESLVDGEIRQLTTSASSAITCGTFDWVYEEEFGLRDGFRFSPDGRFVAYWQIDASEVGSFPLVNNTDSLYPKVTWIPYPKAGTRNPTARIGILELATGETNWLTFPGNAAEHYLARMEWHPHENLLFIQRLNRLQNKLVMYQCQPDSSTGQVVLKESDDAWINIHDEMRWVNPEDLRSGFLWVSERSGWRHIYRYNDGQTWLTVTEGDFDVISLLHVAPDTGWVHFIASPQNATQRYLYRVQLDGTQLSRVTPDDQPGDHSYQISHDGHWAVHTWSRFSQPPRTELIRLEDHSVQRVLADPAKLQQKLDSLELGRTEFLKLEIEPGVEVDAYRILPVGFDPQQRYPLLVYVYGEPAGQTVRDRWGGSTYLWHQMLAQKGYVVMSFDNRGTPAPRGRAWRKSIYRQVGVLAPQDQAAAVRAVLERDKWIDPARVGVWGWSGGGSMTLNALFKFPDVYRMGISVAPVPNQRYYDTIYQERYMGLPSDNVEGFTDGSPLNFARQLKGDLLLIHGTGDDNCHYQATEALINELIRHNKQFSMMAYPNRSHSIREGANTTRHLRQLMTRFIVDKLPAGPLATPTATAAGD